MSELIAGSKRLLLLSNSTMPGEPFFGWSKKHIVKLYGDAKRIVFIPFAGVTISFDEYANAVQKAFRDREYEIIPIHQQEDKISCIEQAEGIMIGGGNTWQLINELHKYQLIEPIRQKVLNGTPYVGWSAGSNVANPTIMTTNDMPVVEPPSFKALNLIPFQSNPHYTDKRIEGQGGENRDDRLLEFIKVNPAVKVVGLPEGTYLEVKGDAITFHGEWMKLFEYGKTPRIEKDGYVLH